MFGHTFRLVATGGTFAVAILLAISCTDASTAARAPRPSSDFVAEGMIHNQVWVPASSGLRLASTGSVRATVTSLGGTISNRTSDGTVALADSARSTVPLAGPYARGESGTILKRARHLGTRVVNGKRIGRYAVAAANRSNSEPPSTMLIVVDDRIAAMTEYSWAKSDGRWRATHTRTSFLDGNGNLAMVFDANAEAVQYRPASSSATRNGVLGDQVLRGVDALARLLKPDALYAASVEEELCLREFMAASAAAAAVVGAGYALTLAYATVTATSAAAIVALNACRINPALCPEAAVAAAAYTVALTAYRQALSLLTGLSMAATAADVALKECNERAEELRQLSKETVVKPGGGDESACDEGEDEWCEYTLSWPDGILRVTKNSCWCEGEYAT